MAVPTQLSDLSATAASNSPAGSDTVGTTMDDYIRAHASIIARIAAGTDKIAPAGVTGTAAILGANTFTGLQIASLGLTVSGADFNSRGITDSATAKALTLSGSGANYLTIANSATNPTIGTSAGSLVISTTGVEQVRVVHQAGADQYITLTGGVSNGVVIGAAGTTNVNMYLVAAGSGAIDLCTTDASNNQVRINHTASADRYITMTGSNGGNPTIGTSAGSLNLSSAVVCGSSLTVITNAFTTGYSQINFGTATPAGGAAQTGLFMGSAAIGVYFGSGAPTVSAVKGSLYLRSDGTTTNNRMYVNTDGGTTWTAVTTAA